MPRCRILISRLGENECTCELREAIGRTWNHSYSPIQKHQQRAAPTKACEAWEFSDVKDRDPRATRPMTHMHDAQRRERCPVVAVVVEFHAQDLV